MRSTGPGTACIAIVDDTPEAQYLYPEFLLFQQLLRRHGVETLIAGPEVLALRDGVLHSGDTPIDLLYNRLTDFYLEAELHRTLREAYLADAVVLTPHPQAHAFYADKRHLATWSNADVLATFGVSAKAQETLSRHVPKTEVVQRANAERLWSEERELVCQACGDECEKHTADHCQACAKACLRCADECRHMAA